MHCVNIVEIAENVTGIEQQTSGQKRSMYDANKANATDTNQSTALLTTVRTSRIWTCSYGISDNNQTHGKCMLSTFSVQNLLSFGIPVKVFQRFLQSTEGIKVQRHASITHFNLL
ncbi:hypothetical protein FRB91_008810 [Serendipita sp. 411]|nr:hypothetical protein FRB91_008810 [Serendipita sp. 411]